ncbi:MAG: hypothetical protein GX868_06705 [Actinobacteria bacterium]|nr:hypothetical protein [Actinomycetota bacterium]
MFPTHRKIVIVAGLVVLVAAGCARSTSSGVRRIELVATDQDEASTVQTGGSAGANDTRATDVAGTGETLAASSANRVETGETAETGATTEAARNVTAGAALSSLDDSQNGEAGESAARRPVQQQGSVRNDDEQFMRLVGAALGTSDLCALWDTLALVPLDARVPQALAQQMQLVTEIMELSNSIVPATLRDDWDAVAEGFDEVAGLLADGHADRAVAAYDDPVFADAQGEIAGWVVSNCG